MCLSTVLDAIRLPSLSFIPTGEKPYFTRWFAGGSFPRRHTAAMSAYGLMDTIALILVQACAAKGQRTLGGNDLGVSHLADLVAICLEISMSLQLFLDSKSGAFELEESRLRSAGALERLYLVAAVALLFGTTQGMAVELSGLRDSG